MPRFLISILFLHSAIPLYGFDHGHSTYGDVLKKVVVVNGPASKVDYQRLAADTKDLDTYLSSLGAVPAKDFDGWNQKQRLAFLINAYNAYTLKLIAKHLYPSGNTDKVLKSIKDIGSLFKSPWDMEFDFLVLFGQKRTLNYIEHQRLRKDFTEPRVHFAINCASIGCPMLQYEAFTEANLESLLEKGAMLFLRDSSRNFFDQKAKELNLSKIFSWFSDDFKKGQVTVQKFVSKYMTDDPEMRAKMEHADLEYTSYDWNLNIL